MPQSGPVYEVTHHVDPEIADDFEAWLGSHVEEMLRLPGLHGAAVFVADGDASGRPGWVTRYQFGSEGDLERYLAEHADAMRLSAQDRFGGRFGVARRVLRETTVADGGVLPIQHCLNCGTVLSGQYCGNCGQRAQSRLISIWELVRDAFGDLFEFDSRLWRTLVPLIVRPGKLTRDYLEGRRVRYMPPFRTYLVLSILFFLVAFFDPRAELGILFAVDSDAASEVAAPAPEDAGPTGSDDEPAPAADAVRDEVLQGLVEDGVLTADQANVAREAAADSESGIVVSFGDDDENGRCNLEDLEDMELSPFFARRLTPERLKIICDRIVADEGQSFLDKLLDNTPAALVILLPLMALVLKILYPLSKRFYVEHLLFVVHLHAFVFLILTVQILFSRVAALAQLPGFISGAAVFSVSAYIPIYVYKAMRRVYEQGHWVTAPKYIVLLLAYFFGFSLILAFAALFAAFSI